MQYNIDMNFHQHWVVSDPIFRCESEQNGRLAYHSYTLCVENMVCETFSLASLRIGIRQRWIMNAGHAYILSEPSIVLLVCCFCWLSLEIFMNKYSMESYVDCWRNQQRLRGLSNSSNRIESWLVDQNSIRSQQICIYSYWKYYIFFQREEMMRLRVFFSGQRERNNADIGCALIETRPSKSKQTYTIIFVCMHDGGRRLFVLWMLLFLIFDNIEPNNNFHFI